METTYSNALSPVEKLFVKSGQIMAVRQWHGGPFYEIDVSLPQVNFEKWDTAQAIKCRISPLHYTDYTPAIWDAAEKICTLYIDTGHAGPGSSWAKDQVEGNAFHYMKIESEKHYPLGSHLVFLGDQTAIGHFCALQQLAQQDTEISGFINFNDAITAAAFSENCAWLPLQPTTAYTEIHTQTDKWILDNRYKIEDCIFYLVGNAKLIVSLRKLLHTHGIGGSRIKSKGFWQ
ncbi:hypothetical protein D0817_13490 [Flavobacterium cupreum]|uniref:Siderophore-interacting protein n=2 Tax=Flavobacterium TaxID=237 RepID=A0A434A728_9FLAO|nr:hypothetical protein [Flavobacterium cupreum]RUT70183.1 hypothetical protein D0817_13490 [Flavobacterium cupreum]